MALLPTAPRVTHRLGQGAAHSLALPRAGRLPLTLHCRLLRSHPHFQMQSLWMGQAHAEGPLT